MTIEEAYTNHSTGMMKYAMYFLKDHHDAEDAVSDCILKLMRSEKFAALDSDQGKAYLFAALRSVCLTALRKRRREEALVTESEPIAPAADESAIVKTDIRRAISKLGERSGKVMKLKFLHDRGVRDISAQLGLSETNVKIMIFRGKKELARVLGEQYAS